MTFLQNQENLQPQFKSFMTFLQKREGLKAAAASFFAKQMQDFTQSGMTPKEYFETVRPQDERAAETFLMNFRYYGEFVTNQYFDDFHNLRWELGRKHKRGSF
ncbi:hypothetical protein [Cytobacillus pseudoceanisediminis]|uniref:hypothetical protein n=1 Tax=Cytobacillus pseudoceanisediminis TaxID=3051614 RepID=UPI003CEE4017